MCMEMCKKVGACPVPAADDGVMTWDELLDHMDTLSMKWRDAIKDWHKTT